MTSWREHPAESAPGLGWARRVVLQQLDALSRLAAIAWRLIDPPKAPSQDATSAAALIAGVCGLERTLRVHARAAWAMRLIDGLRARLVAELQDLDNGRAPPPRVEAHDGGAEVEASASPAVLERVERVERPEQRERPERPERPERFGFEPRGSDDELARILERPTAEVIALICRELGLPEDWPRLAEQAWTREHVDDDGPAPPRRAVLRLALDLPWAPAAPS